MALTKVLRGGLSTGISDSSDATAITISSGEVVTLADDLIIKDSGTIGSASDVDALTIASNGVVSASVGIALGVGTANTASNVLDDYETGTWTPSIGGNASYTTQSGKYTKIGRIVYASALLQINSKGTGSASTCSGFPFASSHVGGGNMGGTVGFFYNAAVNVLSINLYFANGGTSTAFKGNTSASGNIAGNLDIFGNSARVDFSVVYEVS